MSVEQSRSPWKNDGLAADPHKLQEFISRDHRKIVDKLYLSTPHP